MAKIRKIRTKAVEMFYLRFRFVIIRFLAKGISGSYAIALRARGVSEDCYGLDKASDRLRRVGISGIEASWKRQKESRSVKSTWLGAT